MTEEQQLKLQAFFDGELPEKESREIAAWLAKDADATAMLGELRNTRKALADYEPALKVPETREFYWSKIKREIERREPEQRPVSSVSPFAFLRRLLIPISTVATLVVAVLIAVYMIPGNGRPIHVDAMLADAGAFTYRDDAQGMTVVWLSYPAENKLAESGSGDTLPAK
jgi:anti-sigma factor RsiW